MDKNTISKISQQEVKKVVNHIIDDVKDDIEETFKKETNKLVHELKEQLNSNNRLLVNEINNQIKKFGQEI